MKIKTIFYIILFYAIAMAFKYYAVYIQPNVFLNSSQKNDYATLFLGLGPFVGGLVLIYLFKRKTDLKLFSTGIINSLSFVLLLILLFLGFAFYNTGQFNIYIPKYVLLAIIYAIFEEYGWRGYLQTELKPLNKWVKYFIISILWFFWHLEFEPFGSGLTFMNYFMILASSFGLGYLADKSKSLIYVSIFHSLVNLTMTTDNLSVNLQQKLIIVSIVVMAIIISMRVNGSNKKNT